MMDRLYYVMAFFGKVLFYLYTISAAAFQTIHLVNLQNKISAFKIKEVQMVIDLNPRMSRVIASIFLNKVVHLCVLNTFQSKDSS